MQYRPIIREDLTTRVARQIRDAILTGEYEPGDRLPPERDFAERLGVDRNTLRSAVQELEQLGLVERRQGSGCRVLDYRETATLDLLKYLVRTPGTDEIDSDVIQSVIDIARIAFGGAVELVVKRGSPADFAALDSALDALVNAVAEKDHRAVDHAERGLVRSLFRAAHSVASELMWNTYEQVHDTALDPTGEVRTSWVTELIDRNGIDVYRDAIDALKRRDATAARSLTDLILGELPRVMGSSDKKRTAKRSKSAPARVNLKNVVR